MRDLLDRIAIVKRKWDVPTLVEALTGEPVPANHKINSPFNPADETPSFHCYEDSYYCYSTGKYGDVVDLVREIKHCTVERAVQILEEEADELGLVQTVRTVAPKPKLNIDWEDIYSTNNCDLPLDTLKRISGVAERVFHDLWTHDRIGYRVMHWERNIAIYHHAPNGDVVGIKYRNDLGKKTSEPGSDFSSFLYQPFDYTSYVSAFATRCVITEGETDSWAWLSARPDDHVFSLPSGAQSWKDKFLEQLEGYDKVYLAFDHDTAGVAARDKVTRAVGWGRAEHVQFPTNYKDVREAVAAGWKPSIG